MPSLGLIVEPSTTAAASRSADRVLLAEAVATGQGTLRVSHLAGDVLALGRWHLTPAGGPGVEVHRRPTGGRVAASGAGFLHVTLALPHRSALVSQDARALAAEQVMNRAVRGLLGGLEAAGTTPVYPGRDLVTVAGRPIAVLGLEIDAAGGTLVEAVLSVERDQSLLPGLLDRADPHGVVAAAMILPDDVTSVARLLDRAPAFDELVTWVRRGFTTRLDVQIVERSSPCPLAGDDRTFVNGRRRRPEHAGVGRVPTMLGVLEAHVARAEDGRLADVLLAGDFLAPSPTVERLEAALRGCSPAPDAVEAAIAAAMCSPDDFILGVGPLRTVVDAVTQAAR